jgi:site-specific recombinase XerD
VFEINPAKHHTGCMNRYNRSDKPDWVPPRSIKLLDQVRERVRYLHYSLQTEKAYVYWAKAFVLWAARSHGGFRHPREMGQAEVEGFLTMRIPTVLTVQEVRTLLSHMAGTEALLAALLYGSGLRLGHSDVSTTMIHTHVLKVAAGGTSSPLNSLALHLPPG